MVWLNNKRYQELLAIEHDSESRSEEVTRIKEVREMAEAAGLDPYSDNFQDIMTREFIYVAGRKSGAMKAYSAGIFIKDFDEVEIKRALEYATKNNILSKKAIGQKIKK